MDGWTFGVRVLARGCERWQVGTFDPETGNVVLRGGARIGRRDVRRIHYCPTEADSSFGAVGSEDLGWMGLLLAILGVPHDQWAEEVWGRTPRVNTRTVEAPAGVAAIPAGSEPVYSLAEYAPMDENEDDELGRSVSLVSLDVLRAAEWDMDLALAGGD